MGTGTCRPSGASAFDALRRTELGKTILFTDNADWSDEQIVLGYRLIGHRTRN
jgi:hypothetical protein